MRQRLNFTSNGWIVIVFVALYLASFSVTQWLSAQQISLSPGGTPYTLLWAEIDHAVSGDNEIIAATAGSKIVIHSWFLTTAAAVNVTIESGTNSPTTGASTGAMNFGANQFVGEVCGWDGCFETASGSSLNIILSGAVSVDGGIRYFLVQ